PDVELSVDEEADHLSQGEGRWAVWLVREELVEGQRADPDLDRPLLVPDLATHDRADSHRVVPARGTGRRAGIRREFEPAADELVDLDGYGEVVSQEGPEEHGGPVPLGKEASIEQERVVGELMPAAQRAGAEAEQTEHSIGEPIVAAPLARHHEA